MILERHIATFFDHIAIDESGHWLWTGFRTHGGNGYGQFSGKPNTNAFLAHRFAYELMVGPIPEGLQIDHLCRIKNCVNPDHLEAVTPRENVRRHYAALPAIPEARGAIDVHVVTDTCAAIETWAKSADDVAALRDARNKLAAIDEYMALTSRDGRAAVAATMRRLEVRIGQLLGPPSNGGDRRSDQFTREVTDLSANERSAMRTLAANEEIVERVIAESTDEAPASRRKVVEAIKVPGRKVYSRCWRSFPANGSVVVFAAWLLARIDRAQAFAFFDAMVDKDLKGKGDPRSALLKRFESMQRNGEKVSVVTQADWIFRAWNAHRKGQRMDLLKYQSGAFTEPK